MARYMLTREAAPPRGVASTPDQIRRLPNVRVIDQTGDRVMLLEVDPKVLERVRGRIRGWTVLPVVVYAAPWDMDIPFS
jgi:hypothetical protein